MSGVDRRTKRDIVDTIVPAEHRALMRTLDAVISPLARTRENRDDSSFRLTPPPPFNIASLKRPRIGNIIAATSVERSGESASVRKSLDNGSLLFRLYYLLILRALSVLLNRHDLPSCNY